jgi:hypothetical protein
VVAAAAVVGSKQQGKCGKPEKRYYGKNLSTSRVLLAMELGKMDSWVAKNWLLRVLVSAGLSSSVTGDDVE